MKRWMVPGLPFAVSLILSLSTVGTHIHWQDSGFYLSAVHEMGVLYPHGFVVYQLLCKAWTLLFFFVDFTLAVHLFSSLCAALAAGTLALAARDFLTKDRDLPAALTGCLAAAGYTFWFSGIYAKVYSLLYFVLALLLWAVVRTSAEPSKRGTATVAALAGLGWAVHPSVALGSLALGAYFLRSAKRIGWKSTTASLALGLGVALLPGLILPLLSSRDIEMSLGQPRTPGAVLSYLLGSRFTGIPGVFGLESSRVAAFARVFWEEYLGVGLILMTLGILTLYRTRRPALAAGLLWMLPYVVVTILFTIEGQSDHWYVAACLPLMLAVAAGLESLGTLQRSARLLQGAAAGLGLTWAVAANAGDLNLRHDDLAEQYGKLHLQNLEPDAVLLAYTDDVIATTWALQAVKNVRRDVVVVSASQLGGEEIWYDRCLQRHHPDLRLPSEIEAAGGRTNRDSDPVVSAFLKANLGGRRPFYLTAPMPAFLLPEGTILVPQGVVWRLLPAAEDRINLQHWTFPLEPEELPRLFRRKRGLSATAVAGGFETEYEPYERRLQKVLLKARTMLAEWQFRHGHLAPALGLYESVLKLDPAFGKNETLIHSMALGYLSQGRTEQAERYFRTTLEIATRPWVRASSWLALGDLARGRGDGAGARACYEEASKVQGLTSEQNSQVLERLRRP